MPKTWLEVIENDNKTLTINLHKLKREEVNNLYVKLDMFMDEIKDEIKKRDRVVRGGLG